MPEVEFALVLSRMIESVQNDPEHLRATIYELARHKMKEQVLSEHPAQRRQLTKALETAIHGVETFVKKNGANVLPGPERHQQRMLAAHPSAAPVGAEHSVVEVEGSPSMPQRNAFRFTLPWRVASIFGIVLMVVLLATQREWIRNQSSRVAALFTRTAPKQVEMAPPNPARVKNAPSIVEPSPTIPTSFGIYAVSNDKLYELELLPGRAPDIRVAVSTAIQKPSRTLLPEGHVRFIIYRRDSAVNAADRAEVRIIAKIERETGYDAAGKAVVKQVDDTWVMRNISIPFRTAPKKDNPDMYEVESEDPQSTLTPGRYALILKGQAYDFSIAGPISDPRQCLERLAASNGQFYFPCPKL